MGRIMCTQTLWRRLSKQARGSLRVVDAPMPGVTLGSWAARIFQDRGRDLVLAMEQRTYLTLLFPLLPVDQFRSNFVQALSNGLLDLGVPASASRTECAAIEFQPLKRLEDPLLRERLEDVYYTCGIEFAYHSDLRIIQRNLNEMPHPNIDPCTPLEAVRSLFERAPTSRALISQ